MARLTKEETQRIKEFEKANLLTRDMVFYTHHEQYQDSTIIKKLKTKEWDLRLEFEVENEEKHYLNEIRTLVLDKLDFIKKNYPSLENILSFDGNVQKYISQDINYITFLFSTLFQSTFIEELNFRTIYKNDFSCFSILINDIKEHIERNHPKDLILFNILINNPNCNDINNLITTLQMQDLINEKILQLADRYKEYTLIENGEYFNENKLFLEIDLNKPDEEVLQNLKQIRKKLKYSRDLDSSKPRKITKAQEEGNILFIYDCQKLGLRKEYIKSQIQNYFTIQNIDFSVSNNVYNKYLTEIQNNLND